MQSLAVKELTIGSMFSISGATGLKVGTIGMSGANLQFYDGTQWKLVTSTAV